MSIDDKKNSAKLFNIYKRILNNLNLVLRVFANSKCGIFPIIISSCEITCRIFTAEVALHNLSFVNSLAYSKISKNEERNIVLVDCSFRTEKWSALPALYEITNNQDLFCQCSTFYILQLTCKMTFINSWHNNKKLYMI